MTHCDANDLLLNAQARPRVFKMLMVDVGLPKALVGVTWNQFKDPAETLNFRDGAVAEQSVGQELIATLGQGIPLYACSQLTRIHGCYKGQRVLRRS